MQFESAPQDRITLYAAEVERILDAVGHAEAYVTDESRIEDLTDFGRGDGLSATEAARLSAALGIEVQSGSLIADLAESLRRAR